MATKPLTKPWEGQGKTPYTVNYVDNVELHRGGRLEALLENVELLLAANAPPARNDEQVLFRALHACGYSLAHLVRGRAAGRSLRQLKSLHQRILDELVNRNMGLIYDMRRRTRVGGVDADDLMSEGLWTLYRAVVSFDPWRGFRFSTYACTSILRGFLMLTRRRQRHLEQINRLSDQQMTLPATLRERDLETQLQIDQLHSLLSDDRARLTPTERFVIERRLLHDPGVRPDTLESIGEMFDLSKERIRQIQVSAIDKLRDALRGAGSAQTSGVGIMDEEWSGENRRRAVDDQAWIRPGAVHGLRTSDFVVDLVTPVGDGPGIQQTSTHEPMLKNRKTG